MSFGGWEAHDLPTGRGAIHARVAGNGPPVLLLHGYPQSHLMWHAVAPRLVDAGLRVVAADLPGYGDSEPPAPTEDHAAHGKRAMARDLVDAMAALGHERFAVAGHDRGGRVAYRMALDAPAAVERLAVLDIVPTFEVWARADVRLAVFYWHWGFLAQPAPLPEELISANPEATFEHHVRRMGIGNRPERYPPEIMDAYRGFLRRPSIVQAMCEDYRAGATVDRELDAADREAGRTIDCPTLALWGTEGALPAFYDDVLAVWRPWAPGVTGRGITGSHFFPEDDPDTTAAELLAFLRA